MITSLFYRNLVFSGILFLLLSVQAFAQKGTVSGAVIDAETGEELIGVNITLQGTGIGTVTDLSGYYQLTLEPGTYNLVYSYVSYASQTVEGVEVKSGEVKRIDIALQTEDLQLQEIVIQAAQINNNEVALLKLQQKALAVQDGISASEIRRIGASNSAESMKNVTGASVEGGKYVVMRGLGDRYSLTQVNGIVLPSTDPYRNSASLDLLPSTIVENIVTTKTFTPDQPGNFTGGNVNVTTRTIPDQFYLSTSVSVGYNTQSSFEKNFVTDRLSGKYDWLGYDDGTRELPAFFRNADDRTALSRGTALVNSARSASEAEANVNSRRLIEESTEALEDRSFLPDRNQVPLNHRFQFAMGDRKSIFNKKIGYNVALNYGRKYIHYPDRMLNIWQFPSSASSEELQPFLNTQGPQSIDNPSLGGMLSFGIQLDNRNELNISYIYNNDLEQSAGDLQGTFPGAISSVHTFYTRNIGYIQRNVNNIQLNGKHSFGEKNAKLDWVFGYTKSRQDEPGNRSFANHYSPPTDSYVILDAEYDRPFHFFRTLDDRQVNGKVDFELPLGAESKHRLKAGVFGYRKERDFTEYRFQHEERGLRSADYLRFEDAYGDYEAYFADTNYGIVGLNPNGSYKIAPYFLDQTLPTNLYTGEEQVLAGYLMGVVQATPSLKLVGGARIESTEIKVEAESGAVGEISEVDILPSLNLIYAVNDNTNIRVSGSRTLARPNMREIAPFASFDFIGGFVYLGNPDLERTLVWNADIRYELFPKAGELIAVSGFYKYFQDPIQQQLTPVASAGEIRFINVESGLLYGVELEFRKNFDFIDRAFFRNLQFSTNFTYTLSEVDLTPEEIENRQRVNPDIEETRPFQAQSPYILNVNLTYFEPESDFEATLYMNMFGRRLFANGFGGTEDVYEIYGDGNTPTPDLRFNISKRIFSNFVLGFRAENILDYKVQRNIEFKGNYFTQEEYGPGRTFTLSLGYRIE